MTHIEKLTEIRRELTQGILNYLKEKNLEEIYFTTLFTCMLPVENMFGDIESVTAYFAEYMTNNGTITGKDYDLTEEKDWTIHELDVVELAYILDQLEAEKYILYDPEQPVDDNIEIEPF